MPPTSDNSGPIPATEPSRKGALLTIAGFDPSSGAGITADLAVFAANGWYGVSAITALTVQSTQGVNRIEPVSPETIRDTLAALEADLPIAGIKLGMLGTAANVDVIADFLEGRPGTLAVLDPVFCSSSGHELLSLDGLHQLQERLLGKVGWITPNLQELAALTGKPAGSPEQIPAAARLLQKKTGGGINVVVTGGHLQRPDDFLLTAKGNELWLRGEKVDTNSTHGTGCAFSSALLCHLAAGDGPETAVRAAKAYVTEALRSAMPLGKGRGPLNLHRH